MSGWSVGNKTTPNTNAKPMSVVVGKGGGGVVGAGEGRWGSSRV